MVLPQSQTLNLAALFASEHRTLVQIAAARVGAQDAEDLVMDTWAKAVRLLPLVAQRDRAFAPGGWLATSVRNASVDAVRRRAIRRQHDAGIDVAAAQEWEIHDAGDAWLKSHRRTLHTLVSATTQSADCVSEHVLAHETRQALERVVATLPPSQRALYGALTREWSRAETCAALRVSVAAYKDRLLKLRRALRAVHAEIGA